MEATIQNNAITASMQNSEVVNAKNTTKRKSDSLEFLSGCFYIFKKVFLLG